MGMHLLGRQGLLKAEAREDRTAVGGVIAAFELDCSIVCIAKAMFPSWWLEGNASDSRLFGHCASDLCANQR